MSNHEWCRDVAADMTVAEFCDAHGACREGREWALANCQTMREVWATAKPEWLLWVATRRGVLDDRTLRLFAVWSARQVQHLLTDSRSLAALEVAERHARGEATDAELSAAGSAAGSAARSAAGSAAWAADAAAARAAAAAAWAADAAAAGAAARSAAGAAAWAAAWAAARAAAWAADAAAAWAADAAAARAADAAAARAADAEWLREHAEPNFKRQEVAA